MRFLGTLFNVILFITFITLGALIVDKVYFKKKESEVKNVVSKATQGLSTSKISDTPPYTPSGMKWELANTKDPQSISVSLVNSLLFTQNGTPIPELEITGHEWVSRQIYNNNEDLKNSKSMRPVFLENLQKDYWKVVTEIAPDKAVKGILSNLPQSTIATLSKATKEGLLVFTITTQLDKSECPCTSITRVYMSDPIPVETILENYRD